MTMVDLSPEGWEQKWASRLPPPRQEFVAGDKVWYWKVTYKHTSGPRYFYEPAKVVRRWRRYYRIQFANGKRKWANGQWLISL